MFTHFEAHLDVVVEECVPVVSFHFGVQPDAVARCKAAGATVLCSATTVEEARTLVEAGVDNEAIWKIIALNVRVPDMVLGDIRAMVGAELLGAFKSYIENPMPMLV